MHKPANAYVALKRIKPYKPNTCANILTCKTDLMYLVVFYTFYFIVFFQDSNLFYLSEVVSHIQMWFCRFLTFHLLAAAAAECCTTPKPEAFVFNSLHCLKHSDCSHCRCIPVSGALKELSVWLIAGWRDFYYYVKMPSRQEVKGYRRSQINTITWCLVSIFIPPHKSKKKITFDYPVVHFIINLYLYFKKYK